MRAGVAVATVAVAAVAVKRDGGHRSSDPGRSAASAVSVVVARCMLQLCAIDNYF